MDKPSTASEMGIKERPILFTPQMAALVHAGTKTQTRRVVKPQPVATGKAEPGDVVFFGGVLQRVRESGGRNKRAAGMMNAHEWHPYGVPGDRLYVREPWYYDIPPHKLPSVKPADFDPDHLYYRADGECCEQIPECQCASPEVGKPKWKPGIHLSRWACRSVLEVVSVRVERVESITEADAIAEGFRTSYGGEDREVDMLASESFLDTFYRINERAPKGSNPWVWVIEFRKLSETTKPAEEREA